MWAAMSRVAVGNPYAWVRDPVDVATLLDAGPRNRPVVLPYSKLLTANPFVNQAAAVLVADDDTARRLGVPEDRWVHVLGAAGADEPADPRARVAYHRNPALEVALTRRAARHRHVGRRLRPRRALQLLPGDAQAVVAGARAAPARRAHRDRRAHVRGRAGRQLHDPRPGRDDASGSAPAAAPASCTASACSTPGTTPSCSPMRPPQAGTRAAVPAARACARCPAWPWWTSTRARPPWSPTA